MSYNLDPSNIQIGGFPYDINPEYWSNPGRVLRSPRETLDRIEKLSAELSKLRIDAMKQILELFREHPTRVYAFEYEGSEWEGSTIKVYNEVAYSFCPPVSFTYRGDEHREYLYNVFVDDDGIIKVGFHKNNYGNIELGNISDDSIGDVLSFILHAKDYSLSSYRDLQNGGVFYRDIQ